MTESRELPRVLFVSINGAGMGHLSRCLAYAHRMRGRATSVFLSLVAAIEHIEAMGFRGDYFVSEYSARSHYNAWNRELAIRVGLMLEAVRPSVVVFDGTWPFHGLMDACDAYGVQNRVWSNRGLRKPGTVRAPITAKEFDLVIRPGEIGSKFAIERSNTPGRTIVTPPVTLLKDDELLCRQEARNALELAQEGRYALLSLGAGNLNDTREIAQILAEELHARGYAAIYAMPAISTREPKLPEKTARISVYPLARYMRAFDLFVGAAGYNTCCEVIQSRVPCLFVPNTAAADDQARRARIAAGYTPAVVSLCQSADEIAAAVSRVVALANATEQTPAQLRPALDGAEWAAAEILALCERNATA